MARNASRGFGRRQCEDSPHSVSVSFGLVWNWYAASKARAEVIDDTSNHAKRGNANHGKKTVAQLWIFL